MLLLCDCCSIAVLFWFSLVLRFGCGCLLVLVSCCGVAVLVVCCLGWLWLQVLGLDLWGLFCWLVCFELMVCIVVVAA